MLMLKKCYKNAPGVCSAVYSVPKMKFDVFDCFCVVLFLLFLALVDEHLEEHYFSLF